MLSKLQAEHRKIVICTAFKVASGRNPSHAELKILSNTYDKGNSLSKILKNCKEFIKNDIEKVIKKKIVTSKSNTVYILSTFPFNNPKHGGQHRLYNIAKKYKHAGYDVKSVGVLGDESYELTDGFVNFPGNEHFKKHISNSVCMEDWCIGKLFENEDSFFESLSLNINIEPAVIHIENPWLFGFAERLKDEKKLSNTLLVYGSENIEYRLKKDILCNFFSNEWAEIASNHVLDVEKHAIKNADAVLCVSEIEKDFIENLRDNNFESCYLAGNGANRPKISEHGLVEANKITGHKKYALFCGSAHPPNVHGFWHVFQSGIGSLSPDQRIVVAGGIGPILSSDPRFTRASNLDTHCIIAGAINQDCLDALLYNAHLIILPITYGSGTNLKTAEALVSGKYIVATPTAMRGFEGYTEQKRIKICDTPQEFLRNINLFMNENENINIDDDQSYNKVSWDVTLNGIDYMLNNHLTKNDLV